MPRIRTIKPDFFTSDDILSLTVNSRLLYVGLWCHADKAGRMKFKPMNLKFQIMPMEADKFETCINELIKTGLIAIYGEKDKYLCIHEFSTHQKPHHTEKESIIPPFNGDVTVTLPTEGKGKERKGKEGSKPLSDKSDPSEVQEIFLHWQKTLHHPRAVLNPDRKKHITKALKAGYSSADICQAITGCSLTPHNMGKNDNGGVYDDFHIILKLTNIERFMKNANSPPVKQNTKSKYDTIAENCKEFFDDPKTNTDKRTDALHSTKSGLRA